jgi:hypothetical protein
MKKNKLAILLALSILFILSSCTIGKRRYMSGYNINWKHKKSNTETKDYAKLESSPSQETETEDVNQSLIFASTEKDIPVFIKKENVNESCDIITMKNGEEIKAKVIEITETQIKYRLCNNNDSPIRSVEKSNVFMVKYVNGSKEMFDKEIAKPQNTETKKDSEVKKDDVKKDETGKKIKTYDKKKNWAAIVGFILAFLVPFVGIWFCLIGMKSELHKLATVGWIICLVYMLIFIAVYLIPLLGG